MKKKIIVLGAGPAGLALAMKLLQRSDLNAEVIVIETEPWVGGLAPSFEYKGIYFDYGSHRLHPTTAPEIQQDIRSLLGQDLLDRPRNGRIMLMGRFVKFPLKVLDLMVHLPPSFVLNFCIDIITGPFKKRSNQLASFADVLLDGLGNTMCNNFYFPYARKLWGLNPEDISATQAYKRVSARSIVKILYKLVSLLPGIKREGAGRYFYPSKGFGQISQAMALEIKRLGGEIRLSKKVQKIVIQNNTPVSIITESASNWQDCNKGKLPDNSEELMADFVFSTIPVTELINILSQDIPSEIRRACQELKYRGMILLYMILSTDQFTSYDAHYFPEENVVFSRLSEVKNYNCQQEPLGFTGLCAEIPFNVGDTIWKASENELTKRVLEDLNRVQLPVQCPLITSFVRYLPRAYPVYDLSFDSRLQTVNSYVDQISNLIYFGRQGLFAHDNTHHTMEMAYRASECLRHDLVWNSEMWQKFREKFEEHIVED